MRDEKELINTLFHNLGTNEDLETRKKCVYNLLKLKQRSGQIILKILQIQNGEHLEVMDLFFQLLNKSSRVLNADVCITDTDISYESALNIITHINNKNYDATSQYRFAEWILKSRIINDEQKTEIVRTFVSRLDTIKISASSLNGSLNDSVTSGIANPHIVRLSSYLGADMTQQFTSFDETIPGHETMRHLDHSYLYQAYLATSPECMKALLSCGYAISDLDRAKFEEQPQFKQRVIECLRVVIPFTSLDGIYLLKYLCIALGCDTPILEAVHCSIAHLGAKSKAISDAIQLNKKETGADLIAL